jgi:hypothetical protein
MKRVTTENIIKNKAMQIKFVLDDFFSAPTAKITYTNELNE